MSDDDAALGRQIHLRHLRLMAELARSGALGAAADRLGLTQPAASRLLAEAERLAGQPLHQRKGRGLHLLPAGLALARRAQRVIDELALATREMRELGQGLTGLVRLGAVTAPALDIVMPALRHLRATAPGLTVEVEVASSAELALAVSEGRLDFSLSRLPEAAGALAFRPLAEEPVALIARAGHPLAGQPADAQRALAYDWILPGPGAPLRAAVLARLKALGHPAPPGPVATSSFLLTLAMLRQSTAIAPLASAVARQFAGPGDAAFVTLADPFGISVPAYGLVTRADLVPTAAAARVMALMTASAPAR